MVTYFALCTELNVGVVQMLIYIKHSYYVDTVLELGYTRHLNFHSFYTQ